jgi:phenylacetate-CoA ligase
MSAEFTSKIHDQLSVNLLVPLSRLQRLVRRSRRPVMRAFREGLAFRQATANWSDEQKRQWMLKRLRVVVREAYQKTSYYASLFDSAGFDPSAEFSFADYARLPVLDREQIQQRGLEMISSSFTRDELRQHASGGSTGVPTEVWQGPEEIGWGESGTEHFMRTIGVPEGSRTAYFWGHHLDPQATDSLRDRLHAFETNTKWFDCLRLDDEKLETYHQAFSSWRPVCIIAYASAVGSLAEYVRKRGYKPNYPQKCFVTGAEKLWPRHRELVDEVFGRPAHERYGARDAGGIGFQLRPQESLDYHLDWTNVLVEPAGAETETEILITKLHADGMPMLRYRVGDVGRFPSVAVPGEPGFLLHEVLGRVADRIWGRDGRWISGLQIPHLLKDYPIRQFLFLQKADYSVQLQIVPQSEFSGDSSRSIQSLLALNLPGVAVEIVLVDDVPVTKANKWRPVISEVQA